ncbi:hypothetical protein LMG28138_02569 [Pararobbsia alpina]|uniref:Uncharacterized protein n=1 Tax=Pararobbsia alpina TaxID=621374 RepID=A0A6S7B593_9BURK|nr:hypothetical protein LMG28138_02569 [Pararobbsia alpina]
MGICPVEMRHGRLKCATAAFFIVADVVAKQANDIVAMNMALVGLEVKQEPQFETRIGRYSGESNWLSEIVPVPLVERLRGV